jgi:carbon-monoxide dehydrogenase medium subunit
VWQKRNEYKSGTALRAIPQFAAVLLVLGAQVTIGEERETLSKFIARSGPVGKLTDIYIPLDVAGQVYGESHVRRTPADTPIVSATASIHLVDGIVKQARLALTGVWEESVREAKAAEILVGKSLDSKTIAEVVTSIQDEVNPKENYQGSNEYRRAMAGVTVKRALEICSKGGMLS